MDPLFHNISLKHHEVLNKVMVKVKLFIRPWRGKALAQSVNEWINAFKTYIMLGTLYFCTDYVHVHLKTIKRFGYYTMLPSKNTTRLITT